MAEPKEPGEVPAGAAPLFAPNEKIEKINVAEEIKNSFLDYSMSVIISRALPDVRDGLKPSQRRLLFAMFNDLGLLPTRRHLKCARIVGETMGKYHPHGDQAIYPTLVHLAQPWAMRETLVDGQGNFGSVEDDPPAAMRYTEARLTHLGAVLMEDLDRDTVDFVATYDEEHQEPTVLPAAFPNLLVNGGTGIAVGMATNMAPHNLGEVIDAICAQIDAPDISLAQLMRHIKGPDFPTGCRICGTEGIREYFATGRGTVKIRGKVGVEQLKGGREQVVITEIPYNVNRAQLVERIAQLVNEGEVKEFRDITAVRDESDENTRVVIEIKRDAIARVIINNLYEHTALETTFAVNALAIDHGRPKTLSLKELIACYIEHRREVILRRTRFELRKAEDRAEVLEGYLIAIANLDEFIHIIRSSKTRDEARVRLLAFEWSRAQVQRWGILIRSETRLQNGRYALTERQVDAILELRLYQLTGLEIEKVDLEYKQLIETIRDLLDILAKESRVLSLIKAELAVIREKYATPRLTELVPDEGDIAIEDLIANEGVIITMTHNGLIKRTTTASYRAQRRGGKGVIGMTARETSSVDGEAADFIERLFTASTHDYLMFFTNTGRVYVERVHEIPDMGRAAKGRSIANLLELQAGEKVAALIRVQSRLGPNKEDVTWQQPAHVFFATQGGTVKKTALEGFANVRRGGIIAIGIEPGDVLIDVKLTSGHNEVVLITRGGMSIRFSEDDVRSMGRPATGVRGIDLAEGDRVVALSVVDPSATLLVAGENGIGKRTSFEEYRLQSRGGKGIITMKTTERTGGVAGALTVAEADEIMLITAGGQMVRIAVKDVRQTGRNTQGVKLIELDANDRLQAIAPVISEEGGADGGVEASAEG
ncbi:MAG TPA: DNA gyrase subunit A [Verrucomicrobiota bacterium]|nr:DNA gyrase subunit A [Verrucomicrobiota bacterium]HNU53002.1 DNA gyrase subunit A [Verrucomicrobiota bacterium]